MNFLKVYYSSINKQWRRNHVKTTDYHCGVPMNIKQIFIMKALDVPCQKLMGVLNTKDISDSR